MNRQPQYTSNRQYRIVSLSNGKWRLQQYTGNKGTVTFDPWDNCGPAADFEQAKAGLRARDPHVSKAA